MEIKVVIVERLTDLRQTSLCELLFGGETITEKNQIISVILKYFPLLSIVCMGSSEYYDKLSKFLEGTDVKIKMDDCANLESWDVLLVLDLDTPALLHGIVSSFLMDELYPEGS